jgi:hypothetical protein
MNASISLEFPDVIDAARRTHMSVREAAQLLGLAPQRVGFYIRRGDLPATSVNGLDYVLLRKDVLQFDRERRSGKRQTTPGRPGREKLARLQAERELADERAAQLRKLRPTRPIPTREELQRMQRENAARRRARRRAEAQAASSA